jgi:glucoamylase
VDAHDQRAARRPPLVPAAHQRRRANAGTTYTIGDGGPTVDQRTVVDPSFLELVRFGVKPADDPDIVATLPVVDRDLGVTTPNGQF